MEKPIQSHLDLDLWKISVDFTIHLYQITESFPAGEKFGLVSQIRRAGVSVCSNIAEGAARQYPTEFIHFLFISLGSLSEIETQLEISQRLGFIKTLEQDRMVIIRIRQMLARLIHTLKSKSRP